MQSTRSIEDPSEQRGQNLLKILQAQKIKEKRYAATTQNIPLMFYGCFCQKLEEAQKQISSLITEQQERLPKHSQQFQNMTVIKQNIRCLNQPPLQILRQIIFQLYLQISQLQNDSLPENLDAERQKELKDPFIDQVLQILTPLIRDYFIFKQYEYKIKQNQDKGQKSEKIRSDNLIKQLQNEGFLFMSSSYSGNQSYQIQTKEQILQSITENLSEYTINQLFQQLITEQQNNIIDSLEVCRICQRGIPLRNLLSHIESCSNKAQLHQKLSEIKAQWKQLYENIFQQQSKIIERSFIRTQQEVHLLKIFKKTKQFSLSSNRNRNLRRNSSDSEILNYSNSLDMLRQELELFEMNFGQNKFIRAVIKNKEEQIFFQKKINALEINSIINENKSHKEIQEVTSLKSLAFSVQSIIQGGNMVRTKKSLFAHSKESSKSLSSSSLSQSSFSNSKTCSKNNTISHKSGRQNSQRCYQTSQRSPTQKKKTEIIKKIRQVDQKEKEKQNNERLWKTLKVIPRKEFQSQENQENQITLNDFQILRFLGKGAYGNVYLVRRVKTKGLYALKHIKYDEEQRDKQIQLISKQHQIFKKIAGDHLIKAPFSFSDQSGHFFVLQYMPGGDLSKILEQQVYFEEDQAKFYLAEVVLALEHLHKCGIIHRDIKPQNLVIDRNGHLKLTDFGLSEIKMQTKISKTLSNCPIKSNILQPQNKHMRRAALIIKNRSDKLIGTPDYIAPEIITRTSINNKSIDWWSLGILAYEMLVGCRPFSADTIQQVLHNIMQEKIIWPEIGLQQGKISPEAADLISKLLTKNFQTRLGSMGVDEIKQHPFFEGIEWQSVKKKVAPFISCKDPEIFSDSKQDIHLRNQICGQQNGIKMKEKSRKLDSFVRYDLLLSETYESAGQQIEKKKDKLLRLHTLRRSSNMNQDKRKKNQGRKIRFLVS